MDTIKKLNDSLAYVEDNLDQEIHYADVAKIAFCNEYHFRRMFSFLSGVSLTEYIRRRRLTQAGLELTSSNVKIIDIALKYGYQSPDSFAKAFQKVHGITPKEAKRSGQHLKSFPPFTFQLTIQGGLELNYRIEEKEAFVLAGIKKRIPIVFEGENSAITEMRNLITPEMIETFETLSNVEPYGVISASFNFSEERMEEKGELDHLIGVATTKEDVLDLDSHHVPACTWAIFTVVGNFPVETQNVWGRIYSEWLPSSDYQVVNGPEILWTEGEDTADPDYKSEIWIPVTKNG
ncbi:AraC family transcriptional regulator [Shouchella shacheensis]|uniref:AraC family transcriptional regulator n=1 Tax=Shouchella shacheensis TaxID=1649580 RepID=UPI0007403EE2|nr:GyrI-like domain-containing protein [Shouchella shacheensis]